MPEDTVTLIATVLPNNADNKTIIWTSSNPNAATVNDKGLVTAVTKGVTIITATTQNGNKTATCTVTTIVIPVINITLNCKKITLAPGDTITLIATVQPDDANNKTVTWESSNTAVATVNSNGLVTAIANGKSTIIATSQDGSKKATCDVTVDYRSQWEGEWDFVVKTHTYMAADEIDKRDTVYYSGEISIDGTKSIYIKYLENASIILNVDEKGKLWNSIPALYAHYGNFEGNDKVYINLFWGGNGGGTSHIIDGIKKKGCKK